MLGLLRCSRDFLLQQIFYRRRRYQILSDDFLQHCIRIYLQHGGNLLTKGFCLLLCLLRYCGKGGLDWISESCLQSTNGLTVDELSLFGICFLGTVAHVDPEFRARLKACLASYRSPLFAAGNIHGDSLYESTFGIVSVLSHFHRLEGSPEIFLVVLCRTGTPSMLRPFVDTGIDLDGGSCYTNMLGHAAAVGNLDIVSVLVERGANGALALFSFLNGSKDLPDGLYKHLLELLVECSRPTSDFLHFDDALLALIRSSRALLIHPEAPKILLRRKVFCSQFFKYPCMQYFACSYMCAAISNGLDSVVRLLLQHGAYANTMSTWLMFSVERGAASCTEAMIQHGADVGSLDGTGRSALQLARSYVTAPHPRKFTHDRGRFRSPLMKLVTAEEDEETLAAVKRAFELKAQSTMSLNVCAPSCELEPQSLNQEGEAMPVAQNVFEKALRFLSTYYTPALHGHRMEPHHRRIGDLWSLSFYEALRMRFFYVLSYVLLLAVGIIAYIRGDQRVRMPPRSILSAGALLLLAYIWGSSLQTNLPWKLDNGRSVTKQDS